MTTDENKPITVTSQFQKDLENQPDFLAPVYILYRNAAGFGAEYELRLRMLADKTPNLTALSQEKNLETLEDAVFEEFTAHLEPGEADALRKVRQARNKLLHGAMTKLREKLGELGHTHGAMKVRKLEGELTVDRLVKEVRTAPLLAPTAPDVGNLMGWLIQCGIDGTFEQAGKSFHAAIRVLDRLAWAESWRGVKVEG